MPIEVSPAIDLCGLARGLFAGAHGDLLQPGEGIHGLQRNASPARGVSTAHGRLVFLFVCFSLGGNVDTRLIMG